MKTTKQKSKTTTEIKVMTIKARGINIVEDCSESLIIDHDSSHVARHVVTEFRRLRTGPRRIYELQRI